MNIQLIQQLIKSGEIKSWSDVYGYTTVQEMAVVLGRDAQHWGSVRRNPMMLTIQDMVKIMEVLDISRTKFLELAGGGD